MTIKDLLRAATDTEYHVSRTCKMGPVSDAMAVVNQQGQVHGLDNLWIADASIMPGCIRINATTIMIGERVAGFLQRHLARR